MKYLLYISGIALLLLASCQEVELKPYTGRDAIQFVENKATYSWGLALNPQAEYDTCWLTVQTVGRTVGYDRYFKLEQEKAFGMDLVYDHVGNVVDTTYYEIPNQAVLNRDFVDFNNPSLKEKLKVPANTYRMRIPVVMKNAENVPAKLSLQLKMIPEGNTVLGDPKYTRCLITIETTK